MTRSVLVPIANGSEDIESVCIVDTLRRAGANVILASVEVDKTITASRGIKITADVLIGDVAGQTFDAIALPGGMPGAERLRDCALLTELLKAQKEAGRIYAAVCATPAVAFVHHGLVDATTEATCHPNFAERLPNKSAVDQRVVVSGTCVTSRAPGTSIEFALKITELLFGKEKADEVARPMLVAGYV